jgi:uncharacterized protein YktA (UPF0223 family)
MFSKVFSFFITIERVVEHDVEAIISTFTDTVTKLEAAVEAKAEEAKLLYAQADALYETGDAAKLASNKAASVASKIKELVA